MAAFAQVVKAIRAPGRTLLLEPWVFADEWDGKPKDAVCVGLRLMSETSKTVARGEAEKLADEFHPRGGPNWIDAFNDALIRYVVALGICDPNDVSKPSTLLPYAEDQVRTALTSKGARLIFDALDQYEIETSEIEAMATDETIDELVSLLQQTKTEQLPPSLRRLLNHVCGKLDAISSDPSGR